MGKLTEGTLKFRMGGIKFQILGIESQRRPPEKSKTLCFVPLYHFLKYA